MKTALISVFDKTNVLPLAKFLTSKGVKILSTGGTYKKLRKEFRESKYDQSILNENLIEISSMTGFPEILGGRVKTLHPKIHGGILAKRNDEQHMEELQEHEIQPIDMVVVNLYPFEEVVANGAGEYEMIENIDIGGHTLIRAAAKNYKDVLVVTDPSDYDRIMSSWSDLDSVRKLMAKKAWDHIVRYDMAISEQYNDEVIYRRYEKVRDLKYGLNPQQGQAAIYNNPKTSPFPFKVLNGNPGYINLLDALYGWNLVSEVFVTLNMYTAASYKHTSPAGVGTTTSLSKELKKAYLVDPDEELSPVATAYLRARNVDPMSSFGDFIAICGTVDVQTAKLIAKEVSDGIIAHGYHPEALEILKRKKKGSYVILSGFLDSTNSYTKQHLEIREMHGLVMTQGGNTAMIDKEKTWSNIVGSRDFLTDRAKRDLALANITLKFTQSNSVASAMDGQVLGVGAGQQSRIDCVKLVRRKTQNWYLRQHPKCLRLLDLFKKGTRRSTKVNTVVQYIEGTDVSNDLFTEPIEPLTDAEKKQFLDKLDKVSLASDAFFPFRDNIDVAATFGVTDIIQPGGSVQDNVVIDACKQHDMAMAMTGRDMRMFLH